MVDDADIAMMDCVDLWGDMGVQWRQPHRRSGLVTLPSVGAVP